MSADSPVNLPDSVFESMIRAKNPARRMYSSRTAYIAWGIFNLVFAIAFTIIRARTLLGGFGWMIDFFLPISCLLHVFAGSMLFKLPIRFSLAGFMLAVLFAWVLITGIFVNSDFGRSLVFTIGWTSVFALNYLALYLSLEQTLYCGPEIRKWVRWTLIAVMGLSGLVGCGQLVGIGFLRSFFLSMDNVGPFRPNGFTDYPSQLGFQGLAGMALCAAPIIRRDLKWYEWAMFGFFGFVMVGAQYRSMYYAGLLAVFIPVMFYQFKRNRSTAIVILTCIAASLIVPLMLFPKKFEYGLRGAKNDGALKARQISWEQVEPILSVRPWTGIGPDLNIMLSGDVKPIDKWAKTPMDNLYYMVLACFGYTGAIIVAILILLLVGGIMMRISQATGEAKEWGFTALMGLASILLFSLTGNSFMYHPVGFFFVAAVSMSALTWREELEHPPVDNLVIRFRKLISGGHAYRGFKRSLIP
jgi:hypothetical protein